MHMAGQHAPATAVLMRSSLKLAHVRGQLASSASWRTSPPWPAVSLACDRAYEAADAMAASGCRVADMCMRWVLPRISERTATPPTADADKTTSHHSGPAEDVGGDARGTGTLSEAICLAGGACCERTYQRQYPAAPARHAAPCEWLMNDTSWTVKKMALVVHVSSSVGTSFNGKRALPQHKASRAD